jgi:hypothetical protein
MRCCRHMLIKPTRMGSSRFGSWLLDHGADNLRLQGGMSANHGAYAWACLSCRVTLALLLLSMRPNYETGGVEGAYDHLHLSAKKGY